MSIPVPQSLIDFIQTGSKFLIAGHTEPDGDCVGSELALCSVLRRLGKEAIPCSAGPFSRTEVKSYAADFVTAPTDEDKAGARVIVVDCAHLERTGDLAPRLEGLPVAFIDHHKSRELSPRQDDAALFIDSASPSVTLMILSLIEAFGLTPAREEARLLFFGLCTDTGFFRHVDENGGATFSGAAKLIQSGASPKETFALINGGKTLESRIFAGRVLSRAETFFDGRLAVSYEKYEDILQFGIKNRDSDSVYQMLQSIAGVEAIALIRQETPETCGVGLRSRDTVDVSVIAAALGGGGHKNAASAGTRGDISSVKKTVINMFAKLFS